MWLWMKAFSWFLARVRNGLPGRISIPRKSTIGVKGCFAFLDVLE